MWRVQPCNKYYHPEWIELDGQPVNWIGKHKGFGDRAWFISQVKYGKWICDRSERNCFLVYATEFEGRKPLTILIKIRKYATHVLIYHAHVLRKKR